MAAEGHTLSSPVAWRPGQQADQRQVVVVAQAVIIGVEEDLGHGVLLLVLFRDQSVIVPQPDLVLLGGVAVPAGVTRMAEPLVSYYCHRLDKTKREYWVLAPRNQIYIYIGLDHFLCWHHRN